MIVDVSCRESVTFRPDAVEELALTLLRLLELSDETELSVLLCCDEEIRCLNRDFRGKDRPTDVLSFSMREGGGLSGPLLGDIALSMETLERQADEKGWSVEEELAFLLLHGVLHLLGFDHEEEGEAERMEKKTAQLWALFHPEVSTLSRPKACRAALHHAELTNTLRILARNYPNYMEICEIGRSPQGREVWQVTVGDRRDEVGARKAARGQERDEVEARKAATGQERDEVGARKAARGQERDEVGARKAARGQERDEVGARKAARGQERDDVGARKAATGHRKGVVDQRPALYIDANIHAAEIVGSTACMALIHHLLEASSTPEGAELLTRVTFYVVPRISVDGVEHYLETGQYVRSSPLLYPLEEPPEGLLPEDLDGDGLVAQMRIEDPAGAWRVSDKDPRVMVRRTPADSKGPFYRVLPEGRFNRFDGHLLNTPPRARDLDFNRNFPHGWRPEAEQRGAGKFPLSQPETRAVADFIRDHDNIALWLTLHSGIEVIIPPEGDRPYKDYPVEDRALLEQLAAPAIEIMKMPFESLFDMDYGAVFGDFGEWMFEHQGIPGLVLELWSPASRAGISLEDQLKAFRGLVSMEAMHLEVARWLDEHAPSNRVRDWTPFEHPQLGKVELGGWLQGIFHRAPDGPLLEEIGQRFCKFASIMANALPWLEPRELEIKTVGESSIGNPLVTIGVTVVNGGMLSTQLCSLARSRGFAREVEVVLDLPKGLILRVGAERQRLGHLEGYGGMGRAEWLVEVTAPAELRLRIEGHRAGKMERRIMLPC